MSVVGSCYTLLILLSPYHQTVDFWFPLNQYIYRIYVIIYPEYVKCIGEQVNIVYGYGPVCDATNGLLRVRHSVLLCVGRHPCVYKLEPNRSPTTK